MNYDEVITSLQLKLPPAPQPVGFYRPVMIAGTLAFLSGQISRLADGVILTGKAGEGLSLESAQEGARAAALNVLSVIKHQIGFERFRRVVRLTGFVQAAPDFYEISQVMNAASELMIAVFGDAGVHARSAVGMASLPLNAVVEIEATLEVF